MFVLNECDELVTWLVGPLDLAVANTKPCQLPCCRAFSLLAFALVQWCLEVPVGWGTGARLGFHLFTYYSMAWPFSGLPPSLAAPRLFPH